MQVKSHDQLPQHVYEQVKVQLSEIQATERQPATLLVGLSAGLDSVVLLHLLSFVCARFENTAIHAIHVNHGVHEDSDQWAEFCQRYCDRLDIPLVISQQTLINVKSNREAVFRARRYEVFSCHLPKEGLLFTAHHQNDQAETILFNLFRGTGIRGLTAMKPCMTFGPGKLVRPLLSIPRSLLLQYAQSHNLSWVDDPSNDDTDLDRNYIRHRVIPVIERRWPAAQSSISRTGRNLRQAEQIIDEVGMQDIESCAQADYPGVIGNAYLAVLNLGQFHQLSSPRQFNAIRLWIYTNTSITVSSDQLQQIIRDLCAESRSGLFEFNGYQLRVYKEALYLMHTMPVPVQHIENPIIHDDCYIFKGLSVSIRIRGNAKTRSQSNSGFRFLSRKGGERIRHHGQTQRLKSLYQQNSIPTWERDLIPLIYQDDRLIAVPGVVLADNCPFDQSSISKYTDQAGK